MALILHLEKCPVNTSIQARCSYKYLNIRSPLLLFTKAKHHRLGGADVSRGIISGADEKT